MALTGGLLLHIRVREYLHTFAARKARRTASALCHPQCEWCNDVSFVISVMIITSPNNRPLVRMNTYYILGSAHASQGGTIGRPFQPDFLNHYGKPTTDY